MIKADVEAVLSSNAWFAGLPQELADNMYRLGRLRNFESSLIYSADDRVDGIFALVSGQVRLMRTSSTGRLVFLAIASPGAWFGISAALDGKPHAYDAIAIGETTVFHITQEKLNQITAGRIENYSAFVKLLSYNFRAAMQYISTLRTHPPLLVLAHELILMAGRHGRRTDEGICIDLRLSQEDWAAMVGVGRQTINRLLKKLEAMGIASINYTSITIHNMEALEDLVRKDTVHDM